MLNQRLIAEKKTAIMLESGNCLRKGSNIGKDLLFNLSELAF